jgi:hypothetical protein
MRILLSIASLLVLTPALAAWVPPTNPDPQAILGEARIDRVQGRFDDALAKHVWVHTQGARVRPAFVGVRNTFALAEWVRHGDKHPPALAKLQALRDKAQEDVRADRGRYDAFLDFAAINRTLDEETRTRDLFAWVDANDPGTAERIYDLAQPALVDAKDYTLAGKYLQPSATLERLARGYRFMVGDSRADERMRTFAATKFITEAATVVALLALNDRKEEAASAAGVARAVLDNEAMKQALEAAVRGQVPGPFPTREARAAMRAFERQSP